jgi:NAD(P)H-dependent FMN reductase
LSNAAVPDIAYTTCGVPEYNSSIRGCAINRIDRMNVERLMKQLIIAACAD